MQDKYILMPIMYENVKKTSTKAFGVIQCFTEELFVPVQRRGMGKQALWSTPSMVRMI